MSSPVVLVMDFELDQPIFVEGVEFEVEGPFAVELSPWISSWVEEAPILFEFEGSTE